MVSFRALLAAAPLLALAVAQGIAFTSTPAQALAGEQYNITWGGGDGTGVTLTLRRGNPQDLSTVDTIADNVDADYYVWTVPSDLESGDDYALQITQGQSDINYSGLFTVKAGSSSSATSTGTAVPTGFGNSTATITGMASASGTGTAMSRNSTFSTATLTSSNTFTFDESTSTTSQHSSATRTPSSASTSAPSNDAPVRTGSSAALILGIVAAVMLH